MASVALRDVPQGMRIGELSRRVGVAPETLRAWERRYSLISPERTDGGYRVYSSEDERRIRAMTRMREQGATAAEAARLAREDPQRREQAGQGAVVAGHSALSQAGAVLAGRVAPNGAGAGAIAPAPSPRPVLDDACELLLSALEAYDGEAAYRVLEDAAKRFDLDDVLELLVLRALSRLGEEWDEGTAGIGQEHFASNLLRGWMMGLARGWGSGGSSLAILACPPGERHDLGLIAFGLALRAQEWRIAFVGADTPIATVSDIAAELSPRAVVLSCVEGRRLREVRGELERLAAERPLFLGGAGASRRFAGRIGAEALEGEPTYAARRLAAVHA